MRNQLWMSAAAWIIICIMAAPVWAADDEMCVPLGEITLKSPAMEAKRAPVAFPHDVHFDYNCRQCHHTWDKATPISGCTASGCHDLTEAPKTEDGRPVKDTAMQIRYYKNAYHQMCIGCHKEIQIKNEALQASRLPGSEKVAPNGPTGCIQCHPKE